MSKYLRDMVVGQCSSHGKHLHMTLYMYVMVKNWGDHLWQGGTAYTVLPTVRKITDSP